jgi:hypothetical protein
MRIRNTCGPSRLPRSGMRFVPPFVGVAVILAAGLTQAQEANRRPLIEYVRAPDLQTPLTGTNSLAASARSTTTKNGTAAISKVQMRSKDLTAGERWEKFECEFGIPQKDPSLMKGSMETAKYQLDRTCFEMQEVVHYIQDNVFFDCGLRNIGQTSSSSDRCTFWQVPIPLWETLQQARLKSDIDLNLASGHAFVGVQLVLPIGN